ncbi:MAG: hypothetical protein FJZ58_04605 [Chlamydiae bacterium]|nr:hypothetical protein [Chlamydiota bacterium]
MTKYLLVSLCFTMTLTAEGMEKQLPLILPSWEKVQKMNLERGFFLKRKKPGLHKFKQGHVQDLASEWPWGTRIGIGYNTLSEGWDLAAVYAHMQTRNFASTQSQGGVLLPTWQESMQGEKNPWALHLDVADMEIGRDLRPFFQDIIVRPHIGLRGAWIYQKYQEKQEETKSFWAGNCLGMGMRSGVDSFWKLLQSLHLFGHGSMSLLSGMYNLGNKYTPSVSLKTGRNILMAELTAGLQYEADMGGKKKATVRLGYEGNYLFGHTRWIDRLGGFGASLLEGGIPLQGITFGVRIDF